MKWSTVKLIFCRELRDQLRDRRTLFTVAVLPLLLYPMMGMALLQVAQFMREHPTNVWIVGNDNLPQDPTLIVDGKVAPLWTGGEHESSLIELHMTPQGDEEFYKIVEEFKRPGKKRGADLVDRMIQEEMRARNIDLAVFVPRPFEVGDRGNTDGDESNTRADGDESDTTSQEKAKPAIYIFVNSASDKSNIAAERFAKSLESWQKAWVNKALEGQNLSVSIMHPFEIARADVANKNDKKAAAWSKILPFIIMIWCLTGAFYPAVDLCAGEKERGTFETLLSSPANRTDIAIGKLLTVMAFSIATSVLNLISMGFTGLFVFSRMGALGVGAEAAAMGPPPLSAIGWLLLALIPISALFSAMALAAAAFARSSKEGQYYLIPLMMISMPLMMLPMLPAAKLDVGTSLIPISGLMLLLRGLIEGQHNEVIQFAGPVCAVTLVCCWLAIGWVVRQFNSESVLFRASEKFGVGAWMKQVMHQRHDLPSIGNALLCAMVILVVKFFVSFAMQSPESWSHFTKQTLVVLVATVAMPALLMALVLTRNVRKSLRLNTCRLPVAAAAILIAICLHPLIMWFTTLVMYVYPPAGDLVMMQQVIGRLLDDAPNIWMILGLFALAPAIMEELAFRGFILSGFQSIRSKWAAVILSSLCFGLAHSVLQQSIITFGVGMIIGWIAIRTGSLIPCVLYHFTHNAMTVLISMVTPATVAQSPMIGWFMTSPEGSVYQYAIVPGILMAISGMLLLYWILKFGVPREKESVTRFFDFRAIAEKLQLARKRSSS